MEKEYAIWRTNSFNEEILQELVARFYDLELAQSFVDFQNRQGNSFVILHDGKPVFLN